MNIRWNKSRSRGVLTHFALSTLTSPSFGPSLSKITECEYLKASRNPGSATAPQLKYCTPGASRTSSLNLRIDSWVRDLKAAPSPPPIGSMSRRETTLGIRSTEQWLRGTATQQIEDSRPPIFSMKWSANALPRCGVPMVVTDLTVKV